MPFMALNSATGESVDITEFANPRAELQAGVMVCPVCKSPMIIRSGVRVRAHFAHKPDPDRYCIYADYAAGETAEHRNGKLFLRKWLLNEYPLVDVQVEYPIYHGKDVLRIADVIQLYPTGWKVVYELQLAGITVAALEERSRDYLACGCDVIWILGRDADTETNREWVYAHQGCVLWLVWMPGRDCFVLPEDAERVI